MFGIRSKKSGYAKFSAGSGASAPGVSRLVWLDKSVSGLAKAENADVFVYTAQAADDSPDLFITGSDFATPKPTTETNPFVSKYAWTKSELIEYTVERKGQPKLTLHVDHGWRERRRTQRALSTWRA